MDKLKIFNIETGLVILIVAGILVLSCNPMVTIDTGHRGIKTRFGEVIPPPLEEGLHFITPFVDKVTTLDTKTQKGAEVISTYTRDVQNVQIEYAVNYNLKRTEAGNVFKEVGISWEQRILAPTVTGVLKEVVGKWDAVDLVGERDKAADEILARLQNDLDKKGVTVTGFQITNVKFNQEFENAVEAKVTAIQRAEEAKNKTVQIQEEANQKVVSAKAEAEAMRIKTDALAKSPALVQYEAVMAWDGMLPVAIYGSAPIPFINTGH